MTEVMQYVWPLTVLIIFGGMLSIALYALSIAHDLSKLVLQTGLLPKALPPTPHAVLPDITPLPPAPRTAPPATAPLSAPASSGPPLWFAWAQHEIGFHETGDNQGLDKYIALAHCGANGEPWCAIFVNAALEACGIPGTRSASSQSFKTHPAFVKLDTPVRGAIVVFWRGSGPDSGIGHVGFYDGEDANHVRVLGGNENDQVMDEDMPKSSPSFGLVGYWWPKGVPVASGGPVIAPPRAAVATAAQFQTAAPANQQGIVATMFDDAQTAYGPADRTHPGVALPFHFPGPRPQVRVTSKKNGKSVVCAVADVGPWNTNDPYWDHGTRPQAESGMDTTGRKTNKAGIDLNPAAAEAIQLDGKGLVDWEFVQQSPVSTIVPPKVT